MFVSAGRDLKFHSLEEHGLQLSYTPNSSGDVKSISWAKDNGFLTFVTKKSYPEIISIRDPNHIKNVHTITSIDNVSVVAFQRTTKRYLGVGADLGQVAIYDTRSKSISKLLQSVNSKVCCLDFNCDDKNMAICSTTGSVVIYDVFRGVVCEKYEVSSEYMPTAMRYHPSIDRSLAVALEDGTVTQWDTCTGQKKYSSKTHLAAVTGLVLIENSNLLLSVGIDNKFSIHDINTRESTFCCNQPYPLTAIDASFDGIVIAMGSEYGDIFLYDIRQLIKPLNKLRPHSTKVTKIVFENKIKEEYCDDCSELLSVTTSLSKEEVIDTTQYETPVPSKNFPPHVLDHVKKSTVDIKHSSAIKSSTKIPVVERLFNTQDVVEKTTDALRREVCLSVRKSKAKLETHIKSHVGNLEKFMVTEFQTIVDVLDEQFEHFQTTAETKLSGIVRRASE